MPSTPSHSPLDALSECLLRLGRISRAVPASEFLGRAVRSIQKVIPFRSGWWGLGTDTGPGLVPAIHQAEYINLPDSYAVEWREISVVDRFGEDMRRYLGQVQRVDGNHLQNSPAEIAEFDRRHGLHHAMGVAFDDASTGYAFFLAVFRGPQDQAFSDQEAALFHHLLRHVVQLWHHSLQDALAGASKEDIARAALACSDGRVLYSGPELCELIYAEWPTWDGLILPVEVSMRFQSLPCNLRLAKGVIELNAWGDHVWLVRVDPGNASPQLSPRERRVAHLFASGHSYKEIARVLGLTPATVRTYLRNAYLRLGVKNKVQLGDILAIKSGAICADSTKIKG